MLEETAEIACYLSATLQGEYLHIPELFLFFLSFPEINWKVHDFSLTALPVSVILPESIDSSNAFDVEMC